MQESCLNNVNALVKELSRMEQNSTASDKQNINACQGAKAIRFNPVTSILGLTLHDECIRKGIHKMLSKTQCDRTENLFI